MKYRLVVLMMGFAILCGSCRKDLTIDPNNLWYTSDLGQFVTVWEGINTSYTLWPFDTTDWDRIYSYYYDVFSNGSLSDSAWTNVWEELTSSLLDHHLTIVLKRPSSDKRIVLTPGDVEVTARTYYHSGESPVYCLNQMVATGRISDAANAGSFYLGIIDDNIVYLRISKFNITELMTSGNNQQLSIFNQYKSLLRSNRIKATIVDLRNNPGGSAGDLGIFMSCFVDESYIIGYEQEKIGLGRMELGPRIPFRVTPAPECQRVSIPIIALVDINTASMAEIATLAIKQLPNGYSVGERTYGATCALHDNVYIDQFGSFGYPYDPSNYFSIYRMSGHYVYTPLVLFTGVDGTCYEGYGIEPDKTCYFNKEDWDNGIDNQLECAIRFALEKARK